MILRAIANNDFLYDSLYLLNDFFGAASAGVGLDVQRWFYGEDAPVVQNEIAAILGTITGTAAGFVVGASSLKVVRIIDRLSEFAGNAEDLVALIQAINKADEQPVESVKTILLIGGQRIFGDWVARRARAGEINENGDVLGFNLNLSARSEEISSSSLRNSFEHLADFYQFDELALLRKDLGLPDSGSLNDQSTLAKLEIDGNEFFGINAHGQEIILERVNPITSTHAEGDVIQQAINAGLQGKANQATIFVDRPPCRACGVNNGLRSLARNLGVSELTVVSPQGIEVFTPTE